MKISRNFYAGFAAAVSLAIVLSGCSRTTATGGDSEFRSPDPEAIILFDGSDFSHWTDQSNGSVKWRIIDGVMEVVPQTADAFPQGKPKKVGIQTKRRFKDFKMHVEFLIPPGKKDNSGVYLQRRYEIQIVDSFAGRKHSNNCGAIYKQKQPDVNASRAPGQWQSYDIEFRAARFAFKAGKVEKVENAKVTVYHNNKLIQDNVEILSKTGNGDLEGINPAPILLQDHGSKVRFRNVWIVDLS